MTDVGRSAIGKGESQPIAGGVPFAELRGASKLVVTAVSGVTDLVEEMHRNIAALAPPMGTPPSGRTNGITGLVYRSIRGVTRLVGAGLDTALNALASDAQALSTSPRREALRAALNGVLGDHLVASSNPLAIPMQLRRNGQPLEATPIASIDDTAAGDKLLVLIHGLCMNDLQWTRDNGHDHGTGLARDLGYTPLYLRYNSGRPIADNGRELSVLLERLVADWPQPVSELVLLGHSMGGLVARSACGHASVNRQRWLQRLDRLLFLGTPHHGAPLERAGNRLNLLLGASPYSAPFARLGDVRSAGIRDLRHGAKGGDAITSRGVALPEGVACYAVAASRQRAASGKRATLRGDGLVPVRSALGQHADPSRALPIPESRQALFHGLGHFDLLGDAAVYRQLREWLAGERASR